jgi:hypothetical protein
MTEEYIFRNGRGKEKNISGLAFDALSGEETNGRRIYCEGELILRLDERVTRELETQLCCSLLK